MRRAKSFIKYEANKIFLATKNESKIDDFKIYLGDSYEIETPLSNDAKIDVAEGMTSVEENALAKARAWCAVSGKITIGDDTGFFIHELNGEPGVAARRWGGELGEKVSNEDFWKYLQEKTMNLKSLDCHFVQCVAIVTPDGKERIVKNITKGVLDRGKLNSPYNGSGYPLGAVFVADNRTKKWDEMSDQEKKEFDKDFILDLNNALESLTN